MWETNSHLIKHNLIWLHVYNEFSNESDRVHYLSINLDKQMRSFECDVYFRRSMLIWPIRKKWYVIKMLIIWSNHLLFSPCNTSFDEVSNGQTSVKIIDERFWWGEFIEVFNRWYFTTSSPSERIEHQVNRLSFL